MRLPHCRISQSLPHSGLVAQIAFWKDIADMGAESEVDNEVVANTTPNVGGPLEVTPGDQDQLCPRNMPLIRKWLMMMIICMGTVCV